MTITGEPEELVALRLRVQALRRCLGVHLATFRHTSGLSQRQLAQRLECSPSLIARVEKGERPMSANRWVIADEVCAANGALIDEHCGLVEVEREYLGELRLRREVSRHRTALARLGAQTPPAGLPVAPAARAGSVQVDDTGDDRWWDGVLEDIGEELAQEMRVVIEKLEQAVGRRRALQVLSLLLATAKLSDLDTDEQTRRVRAVDEPDRVDAQVVRHLAATLAHYRRLDDTLGPCAVLDGVLVQHELVHHLLPRTSEQWYKYLRILDSGMAAAIGNYLLNMDAPAAARGWFVHARKAGHAGESPAHAAYAAALLSNVARLAGDTPAALDAAAAARSLAARSRDPQVKALAEQYAAGPMPWTATTTPA